MKVDDIVLYAIYIGIPLFALVFAYKHFKDKDSKIEDFKEQSLKDTLYDELKRKTDQFGIKTKGFKLVRDFQIVGHPRKYMIIDVEIPQYTLNPKTNAVEVMEVKYKFNEETKEQEAIENKPIETRLMIVKSGNKNMLLRFLQLRDNYFIFELKDGYEGILKVEAEKKKMCIQGLLDFETFGNVWIMSEGGHEYLSNISIKRALEQNIMHSENMADRVVHYDIQQAKLERRDRIITELEKSKYEDKKEAGDSTIV